MKIKKYIDMIVENGNKEDMECLSEMLEKSLHKMKEYDYDDYKEYKMKLYGMANNYKFDEEMAHEIVENMKPLGELWNIDTIRQVKNNYGINEDLYDFYIVMNSLANDYGEIINTNDVDTFVKMAKAFIKDEDAKNKKVWLYFNTIPKED